MPELATSPFATAHAVIGVRLAVARGQTAARGCGHAVDDDATTCPVCGAPTWVLLDDEAAAVRARRDLERRFDDTPLVVAFAREGDGAEAAYVGCGVSGSAMSAGGVPLPDIGALKRTLAERLAPLGVQIERAFGLWTFAAV